MTEVKHGFFVFLPLNNFGFLYDFNVSEYNIGDYKKYIPHEKAFH